MKNIIFIILSILFITSCNKSKTPAITIAAPTALSYSVSELTLQKNVPLDFLFPQVTGEKITYSVTPALPPGLYLSSSQGSLSGIPTAVSQMKEYLISAKNEAGSSTFVIKIIVNEKVIPDIKYIPASTALRKGQTMTPISVVANNGTFTSFTLTNSLPNGLSLNSQTGTISGTPTEVSPLMTTVVKGLTTTGDFVLASIAIQVNDIPPNNLNYSPQSLILIKDSAFNSSLPTYSGGEITNYSVVPALPAGINLDSSTGKISGTPTYVKENLAYEIIGSNSGGSSSYIINLEIKDVPPQGLSYGISTLNLRRTTALNEIRPTTTGGGAITSYSISPTLPTGLTFNTATGAIVGTPTIVSPTAIYTITATNSGGNSQTNLSIIVKDLPPQNLVYSISNLFLVKNTQMTNLLPIVSGGAVSSYAISPALPAGLTFNNLNGEISGKPLDILNSVSYTVSAINSEGSSSYSFYITVKDEAPQNLVYPTNEMIFQKGTLITEQIPTNEKGVIKNYTSNPIVLPTGLILDNILGVIKGTPTMVAERTKYTITGTNATGQTSKDIYITVNDKAPINMQYPLSNYVFNRGVEISPIEPTNSGGAVILYSISPALPAGLSLNSINGKITGTPTGYQSSQTYTLYGTNSGGTASVNFTISINDFPPDDLFYGSSSKFLTKDQSLGDGIFPIYTGGTIVNFSVTPALPAGLFLDSNTGAILGTPTTIDATLKSYTIVGINSGGSVSITIQIKVNDILPTVALSLTEYKIQKNTVLSVGSTPISPTTTGGTPTLFTLIPIGDGLPAGLSFNLLTGKITGTPTVVTANRSFILKAENDGGFSTVQFSLEITEIPPSNISNILSSYVIDRFISLPYTDVAISPTISGGPVTLWTITPTLPTGLSFNSSNGQITGKPTKGTDLISYTLTATNSGGSTNKIFTMKIKDLPPANLTYDTSSITKISADAWFILPPTYTGGEITSFTTVPALPNGIKINSDGSISRDIAINIPPQAMTIYTIKGANAEGFSNATIGIEILDAPPTALQYLNGKSEGITENLVYFTEGVMGSYLPQNSGGYISEYVVNSYFYYTKGPNFSTNNSDIILNQSTELPLGLTYNTSTGELSGTISAVSLLSNRHGLLISGNNSAGSATVNINIILNKKPIANAGSNFNTTINTTTTLDGSLSADPDFDPETILDPDPSKRILGIDIKTYTWTLISKPAGSSFIIGNLNNSLTKTPNFIPDALGSYQFQLVVNDGLVDSIASTVIVTVNDVPPSNLGYGSSAYGLNNFQYQKNESLNLTATSTGGSPTSYSITPALPAGINFNTSTGKITGSSSIAKIPTAHTITATNSGGSTSVILNLWINQSPTAAIVAVSKHPMPSTLTLYSTGSVDPDISYYSQAPWSVFPKILTYNWSIISKPILSNANLSANTDANPIITPDKKGSYTFQLIVSDGNVSSPAVTATVTAAIPPTGLTYGIQNSFAANNFVYTVNTDTINRSLSFSGDSPMVFAISPGLPSGLNFDTNTGTISGIPTTGQLPTNYTISAVNDGGSSSFVMKLWINEYPIANAGTNITNAAIGTSVSLNGNGTSDIDGTITNTAPYNVGVTKLYSWELVGIPAGSTLTTSNINNQGSVNPSIVPDVEGDYVFRLKFFDGFVNSTNESLVKVTTVNPITRNNYPVAHAGAELLEAFNNSVISLDGSKSTTEVSSLTYEWTIISTPVGSSANIINSLNSVASFQPDVEGVYLFKLCVNNTFNTDCDYAQLLTKNNYTPITSNINVDITLTKNQSPYKLMNDITITAGAKLTIQPGVIIDGNNFSIKVSSGSIDAVGGLTSTDFSGLIYLKNLKVNAVSPGSSSIKLYHVIYNGGELCSKGTGTVSCQGLIDWRWNRFLNVGGNGYIGDSAGANYIIENTFYNSTGYSISSHVPAFDIKTNFVYKPAGGEATYGLYFLRIIKDSSLILNVSENYFVNKDNRVFIHSTNNVSQKSNVTKNYWDKLTASLIRSHIVNPSFLNFEPYNTSFKFSNNAGSVRNGYKYLIP